MGLEPCSHWKKALEQCGSPLLSSRKQSVVVHTLEHSVLRIKQRVGLTETNQNPRALCPLSADVAGHLNLFPNPKGWVASVHTESKAVSQSTVPRRHWRGLCPQSEDCFSSPSRLFSAAAKSKGQTLLTLEVCQILDLHNRTTVNLAFFSL